MSDRESAPFGYPGETFPVSGPQGGVSETTKQPQDVARQLRSLSSAMDDVARGIDRNGDLLDLEWNDVESWITDLEGIRSLVEDEGRG